MLEATFQIRVPFLGEMREPGEVVGGEDLAGVSRTVLDALVAQKIILLNDSSAPGPHDPEAVAHLQARMDKLADQLTASEVARAADAKAASEQIAAMSEAHTAAINALREALPSAVKIVVQQEIATVEPAMVARAVEAASASATTAPRQPQRRA